MSNQHRSRYEDTPSAFARELCVALKAGYTLHKTADGITLRPDGLDREHLLGCDSTGRLGDGVNPSFEEIDGIYQLLTRFGFERQHEFSCKFEFKDGRVQILPRTFFAASFASAAAAYDAGGAAAVAVEPMAIHVPTFGRYRDVDGGAGGGGPAVPLPEPRQDGIELEGCPDRPATAGVDREEAEAERLQLSTASRGRGFERP